jgi:MFS family permease
VEGRNQKNLNKPQVEMQFDAAKDTAGVLAPEQGFRAAYPSLRQGWSAVAILFFMYCVAFLDRNLLYLVVGPVKSDLRISDVELSFLFGAAFAVSFSLGALPFGWAIDKFSRRSVVWIGVVTWSIATAACGLAKSFPALFFARVGVGAGEASINPAAQSILADSFPPERLALPMLIYSLGGQVGQSISLIIAGLLVSLIPPSHIYNVGVFGFLKGWNLNFLVVGVPGILFSFAIYAIREPIRQSLIHKYNTGFGDYFQFLKNNSRFFIGHHAGLCTLAACATGIFAWTPTYFTRVHSWPASQVGYFLGAAVLIGVVVAIPIHGALSDWWYGRGRRDAHLRYLMLSMALAYPIGIWAFLVPSPWLSLVMIAAFFAVMGGFVGLPLTILQIAVDGNLRGKAAGVSHLLTGTLAVGGGPTVVALLTDKVYHSASLVGYALSTCIGLAIPLSLLFFVLCAGPYRRMAQQR